MTGLVTVEDFPHGLRCAECNEEIPHGLRYSERLDGVETWEDDIPLFDVKAGDPCFFTVLTCVPCGLGQRQA